MKTSNKILLGSLLFLFFGVSTLMIAGRMSIIPRVTIKGNKVMTKKVMALNGFSSVELRGNMQLMISKGPYKVEVEAEENIMPHIDLSLDRKTLDVRFDDGIGIFDAEDIKVHVQMPHLNRIENYSIGAIIIKDLFETDDMYIQSGGAGLTELNVRCDRLQVESYGVGTVRVRGKAKRMDIKSRGAGDIELFGIIADRVHVNMSGVSSVRVQAVKELEADIRGAGSLYYRGDPRTKIRQSGVGSAKQVEGKVEERGAEMDGEEMGEGDGEGVGERDQ